MEVAIPGENPAMECAGCTVIATGALAGQSGVVTGAGTGIGQAIALRLMALGMDVIGLARREQPLTETAALASGLPGRFRHHCIDLRDAALAETTIAAIGRDHGIDLLVNNAGGQFYAPAIDISRKGWDAVIDLNLSSVFTLTHAAHPFLARRGGAVVNISLSGVDRGTKGLAHSIAARAGVLGMTRTLALEWAREGIRLNCIGPGIVQTHGLERPVARDRAAGLISDTPAGRATSPAEVAELVAFLASPAGQLMTGQILYIDGGAHIGPGLDMIA